MSEHEHTWEPVAGACGQYGCDCGATGWRNSRGAIVPHKKAKSTRDPWTAKNAHGDAIGIGGTWVTRKPGAE